MLEHVEDQQVVLAEMQRVLRSDGTLLVTVPAFRHLWSGHDVVHQHRRRDRADELKQELEISGFHIIYISYFNTHLYPLVALSRLLIKKSENEPKSDMQAPPSWLNSLLNGIFRAEKIWIGRLSMPLGVSLLALVRKNG